MKRPGLILSAALLASLCVATAIAQDTTSPPTSPPPSHNTTSPHQANDRPAARDQRPADNDAIRARLERRLRLTREVQRHYEAAIAAFDEGKSLEDLSPEIQRTLRRGEGDWLRTMEQPRLGMDRPASPDRPGQARLAPARRERILRFLEEQFPEMARRFKEASHGDPREVDKLIGRLGPRVGELIDLREREPELYEFRLAELRAGLELVQASQRIDRMMRADEPDPLQVERARQALHDILDRQFEARLHAQEHELHKLSAQLDGLRKAIEQQKTHRQTMIDEHVDQLMNRLAQRARRPEGRWKRQDRPTQSPRDDRD